MSSEWPAVPLDELTDGTTITYGVVKPGDECVNGVKFVRGGDVVAGRILTAQLRTITTDVSQQYARTLLQGGELLVSLVGNPGEVALVPASLKGANIARQVGLVRIDPDKADAKYVQFYLRSKTGRDVLLAHSKGSVQQVINLKDLKTVKVPLPPISVQRNVAGFMQALDDRITLLGETNATLEAIAQAMFKSWFVDFYAVRAKMEGRTPEGMDEATAALFPDGFETSELGEVPRGWRIEPLGDVVKIAYGKNLPTSKLLDSGYPVYGGNGPIGFSDKFLYHSRQILVACRGAASGKFNQSVPRSFVTNNSLVLESNDTTPLPFGYLKGCISSADLTPFVTGSAQPQVTIDNLRNFKLLIPSASTSKAFESFSSSIEDKIEENNKQAQTLATLRDALLPRLISGSLHLPSSSLTVAL